MRKLQKNSVKSNLRKTPLEQVSEHLESDDESAWYAERLEILGKIMFGDLWKPQEPTPHPDPLPDRSGEGKMQAKEFKT